MIIAVLTSGETCAARSTRFRYRLTRSIAGGLRTGALGIGEVGSDRDLPWVGDHLRRLLVEVVRQLVVVAAASMQAPSSTACITALLMPCP